MSPRLRSRPEKKKKKGEKGGRKHRACSHAGRRNQEGKKKGGIRVGYRLRFRRFRSVHHRSGEMEHYYILRVHEKEGER